LLARLEAGVHVPRSEQREVVCCTSRRGIR